MKQPRPSPAQLKVLRALFRGVVLYSTPQLGFWLADRHTPRVRTRTFLRMKQYGWVTSCYFHQSATEHRISLAGRKALEEADEIRPTLRAAGYLKEEKT